MSERLLWDGGKGRCEENHDITPREVSIAPFLKMRKKHMRRWITYPFVSSDLLAIGSKVLSICTTSLGPRYVELGTDFFQVPN